MGTGIHIPEPCHESWQAMQPQQNGRFCDSCCKVVVDFTAMSNEQIMDYLQSRKEEKVCGRFKKKQMSAPAVKVKPIRVKWQLQKFAAALWLAFGAMLFTACNTPDPKLVQKESQPKSNQNLTGIVIIPSEQISRAATPEKLITTPATPKCVTVSEETHTMGAPVQGEITEDQFMGQPAVVEIVKGEVLAVDTLIKPDTLPQSLPVIIEHEMGKVQYVPEKDKNNKKKKRKN
jgi:hypothetical protein